MDTKKTGELIRCLRRESGMTQERFAEQFHVSSRAVSRWETGSNLPDLDILIEMADRYGLDIRELIDGERRGAPAGRKTRAPAFRAHIRKPFSRGLCGDTFWTKRPKKRCAFRRVAFFAARSDEWLRRGAHHPGSRGRGKPPGEGGTPYA